MEWRSRARILRAAGWRFGLRVNLVGELVQRIGHIAHGRDRFPAHLWHDGIVHIGNGLAQLRLDSLDGIFDVPAYARSGRWIRVMKVTLSGNLAK